MAHTRLLVKTRQEISRENELSVEELEDLIDLLLVLSYREGSPFRFDLSKVPDKTAVAVARKYKEAGWDVDLAQGGFIVIR